MAIKTWYEVFTTIYEHDETMTIKTFDTLPEAQAWKNAHERDYLELHIDRWEEDIDGNVELVEDIE